MENSLISEIESVRQKHLKRFKVLLVIDLVLIALLVGIYFLYTKLINPSDTSSGFTIISFGGFIIIVLLISAFVVSIVPYNHYCKSVVELKVMEDVYHKDKYSYVESNGATFNELNYSNIFKRPDEFNVSDTIRSNYKGVDFLSTEYTFIDIYYTTDSKGHREEHRTPYYGRVFIYDLKREFNGSVSIFEKCSNNTVFNKNIYDEKIEFESIEINKKFTITTTNKETAFKIIRPKEIMGIIDFNNDNKGDVAFIFDKNKLTFVVSDIKIDFNFNLFKKFDEKIIEDIRKYYEMPLRIIDIFNLDSSKFNNKDLEN